MNCCGSPSTGSAARETPRVRGRLDRSRGGGIDMTERLRLTWAQLVLPEAQAVPAVIADIQFKMRTTSATAAQRVPGATISRPRTAEIRARFS